MKYLKYSIIYANLIAKRTVSILFLQAKPEAYFSALGPRIAGGNGGIWFRDLVAG